MIGADRPIGLMSTEIAGRRQKRTVMIVIAISLIAFVALLPFLGWRLGQVKAFIPAYEGALWAVDVVTAVLLFGQFMELRSRSLLVLAAGYVFNAAMVVPHALTFPEAFNFAGLLGAGPQTSAWLYLFWHGGFPLFVLAYALLSRYENDQIQIAPPLAVFVACMGTIVLAASLTALTTLGHDWLPAIVRDDAYTPGLVSGVGPTIVFSALSALAILAWRRNPTVLDLWLMAVLVAWLLEIAYSGRLGMRRYDVGWYAGRVYGLLAGSFLLAMLLVETRRLYGRLSFALELAQRRNAELIRSREDFARVQRIEATGRVVASAAHDFNNILTVIMNTLEAMLLDPMLSEKYRRPLQTSLSAARQGARMNEQLLAFARPQALKPEILNPNDVIKGVEGILVKAVGEGVRVATKLDPELWPVEVDRMQFESALVNLAVNARDAMDGKGEIAFETRKVSAVDGSLSDLAAGDYALIEVRDTGPGFPPEIAARAFEPFFTTKEPGKGTGLGLSQVYGFAQGSGGLARIASTPRGGAVIEVFLRRSARSVGGKMEAANSMPS